MARRPLTDAPEVEVASRAALRDWLARHHTQGSGVWLVSYKRADPDRYLPYEAIVEECLSFGWVDSLTRAKDDLRSMLWIAPRKPGSNWSKPNTDRIARLDAAGLLAPAGRAAVARAQADGTWTALDGVEALEVPPDLAAALDALPPARAHWDAFPRSVRRGVLEIVLNAKRAETRGKRIAEIARAAAENVRPFQWRG
jgi:uncharacterized protein YdeI (YjbR/CyaY-like superfamily)